MTFGERLRELRAQNNLTQEQLGQIIHMNPKCISYYENGHKEPKLTTIKLLSKALNTNYDYLIEGVK